MIESSVTVDQAPALNRIDNRNRSMTDRLDYLSILIGDQGRSDNQGILKTHD